MIEPIAENNVGKQDNATLTKAANIMKKYKKKYNDIKNDYQKRTKICEKLGALKFQKVVFKVEKIKYDILQKVCPNFIKYYEKLSDKIVKRKLKKYHSEPRKKEILENHRLNKMLMRKEINRKQNRNYHIDEYLPTSMVHYLEWNKKIHKKFWISTKIVQVFVVDGFNIFLFVYHITGKCFNHNIVRSMMR